MKVFNADIVARGSRKNISQFEPLRERVCLNSPITGSSLSQSFNSSIFLSDVS